MGQKFGPALMVAALLLGALYASFYTVDQTETAVLIQLGQLDEKTIEPGLHIKIPIIQKVVIFDGRLLDYDAPRMEILSADKNNLSIKNFAKWRIVNPILFYKTLRDMDGALLRLSDVIDSELRLELGRHLMIDILAKSRTELLEAVKKRINNWAQNYGISVVDVRINRIDLPPENQQAVYARMKAERGRIAGQYRAEGQEEALKIKVAADSQRTILLAEARRKAQVIEGQGDAEAARIYAEAFSQDPTFFDFMRTIEAARKALGDKTLLMMSPENELLRFLKQSGADLGGD